MTPIIRRLSANDLDAVLHIQSGAYPALAESAAAIADRMLQAPDWCWGAETNGQLCAYLLTHPWPWPTPPEWNTSLPALPAHHHSLYVHDLALAAPARGTGVATRLIHTVLQRARHARFTDVRLVAVQQSQAFWQRYGFQVLRTHAELTTTLTSYGSDARLMQHHL
jgi:ribosomal protein S18 acetylase RimI-like enzyme